MSPTRRAIGKNLPSVDEIVNPDLAKLIPEVTGESGPYPAGGAVAALVAALAASLAAAAADCSRDDWDEAPGARAQAQALKRRATELAERDRSDYALAKQALAERTGPSLAGGDHPPRDDARDWRLGEAVRDAAAPPLELAATAADIAQLAGSIAERGAGDVRADAVVAATLAAAASRAAAALVQVNLVVGGDREPALRAARRAEEAAAAAKLAANSGG